MINHCKEKKEFREDPIHKGQCGHYWPDYGRCTNPVLHALLPVTKTKDLQFCVCPTKGARP